jgi:predicted nucleotidyltransferase
MGVNNGNKALSAYPGVNQTLNDLRQRVESILLDNFIGMYLYGSLAMDAFQPSSSDIDFVVITGGQIDKTSIDALEKMHQQLAKTEDKWVKKLEGAYIPKSVIQRHDLNHPAVPTLNESKFYMAPLGGDWIIQRHVLREYEAVISGPSP